MNVTLISLQRYSKFFQKQVFYLRKTIMPHGWSFCCWHLVSLFWHAIFVRMLRTSCMVPSPLCSRLRVFQIYLRKNQCLRASDAFCAIRLSRFFIVFIQAFHFYAHAAYLVHATFDTLPPLALFSQITNRSIHNVHPQAHMYLYVYYFF